jgi:hypothetical protein
VRILTQVLCIKRVNRAHRVLRLLGTAHLDLFVPLPTLQQFKCDSPKSTVVKSPCHSPPRERGEIHAVTSLFPASEATRERSDCYFRVADHSPTTATCIKRCISSIVTLCSAVCFAMIEPNGTSRKPPALYHGEFYIPGYFPQKIEIKSIES